MPILIYKYLFPVRNPPPFFDRAEARTGVAPSEIHYPKTIHKLIHSFCG
jgi:hypothetical protein